ncbi:hypothetical protein GGR20_003442 [Devosia subaequoris]|uniref:Uncharacterized protein n=1 Tax=Devosia subaequoris TaxID=395930 RepID=A0A7W6IQ48_9HYPH|nr:hypothetical protein [Devosia subaequoris]MBB4053780.1 hypothetical protein [Devosia subaequoris]MCP1211023.1 hypothetical protein [Devosia subaequoris]
MPDRFATHADGLESPASSGFAIIPDDSADLPHVTRAVYIGTAGNLAVTLASGDQVTLVNLPSATLLPVRIARVEATGTTATDLVGLL